MSAAGVLTPGGTVPEGADDSEASHFAVPRISVLAQNASGLSELVYGFNDNSLFVQWDGFTPDQSFGVTRVEARLYFDGQIDVRLLEKNENESILGLSNGGGIPADYAPSRFEDSVTCGAPPCYANCEQTCADGGLNPSIDDAQVAVFGQPLYTADFLPLDGMDDGTHAQLVQAILLDDRLPIHCCVRNAYEDNAAVFDALTDSQMTALRDAFPFSDSATPAETRTFFAWFYTVALEQQRRDLQRTVAQDLDVDLPRGNDSAVRFVAANGDADADGDCNVSEYLEAVSPPLDDQTANTFVVNALDFSTADGDGTGCITCFEPSDAMPQQRVHAADPDGDNVITLSELLRVIQFFNSGGLHCAQPDETTEDGFVPARDMAEESCTPHSSDYAPQDWQVSLSELLRLIQFFNSGGYTFCPSDGTEDGYCPGPSAP